MCNPFRFRKVDNFFTEVLTDTFRLGTVPIFWGCPNISEYFDIDGIIVFDERDDEGYVTQAEAAGEDSVYISRIRKDNSVKNGLSFWCVADNLRKGAALNAVQIAELLIRDYLKK